MAPAGGRLDSPKIDVFNPRRLSDRQVEAIATGREPLLAEILDFVKQAAAGRAIQHLGLIAPRGFGKSFLLRQLRLRVERLAEQGVPVAFAHLPEELPNVASIAALIGEIGRFISGDLTGGIGALREERPDALDQALAALDATLDQRFGPGQGLAVAAIENFDALLDKLVRKAARAVRRRDGAGSARGKGGRAGPSAGELAVELALRDVLERRGNRLMLVVSATRDICNTEPGHPLFQWLKERPLPPWTTADVLEYAQRRRRLASGPEARLTPQEQIQLRALADFTSGAPRMIAVLVDHLLARNLDQATLNLAALIDELTPYYKHRVDDLSDECQQVFDALLRGGEPVSQTELAARFAEPDLTQGDIAEAFRRLKDERLVIGTPERGGSGKSMLFRAADRVMAYWYKQRQVIGHDPARSGISHFEEAVELLVAWYSRAELRQEAEGFARRGRREEAALLLHLARHGIDDLGPGGDGASRGRRGPRRHLIFGLVLRLELLLRLLRPEDRAAGQEVLDGLSSSGGAGLIERLEDASEGADGRWRVFLLCALAVAHAVCDGTAAGPREDERAEASLQQALCVAGTDQDACILVRGLSATVQVDVLGDRAAALREIESMDAATARSPEARLITHLDGSWASWWRSDYETALSRAESALECATGLGLPAWECRALRQMAFALHRLGRIKEAMDTARRAAERARVAGDAGKESEVLNLVSWSLGALGRHQGALGAAEESAERARAAGDLGRASKALDQRSRTLSALGRQDDSLAAARESLALAREACDDQREIESARALFEALHRLRHYDAMLAEAKEASKRWTRLGRLDGQVESMVHEAAALLSLDRKDDADALAGQAIALCADDDRLRQSALARWGYFLGESGRHAEAIARHTEAAALAAQLGDILTRTQSLRNILIWAGRLPRSADLATQGQTILDAFVQLAELDPTSARIWTDAALRAAAALGRYDTFETGLRRVAHAADEEGFGYILLSGELARIAETDGRARAYAALVSVLAALTPEAGQAAPGPDPRVGFVRTLTIVLKDPGLLRDLADLLEEQDGTAHQSQIDALRARAQDIEGGGQPAALERVDPDLARMLTALREPDPLPTALPRADDPAATLAPCVLAPPAAARFAGLPLAPADPATVARFDRLAPALGIPNLAAFDSTGLRSAELAFLPGALLLLLPDRDGAVAVPFVVQGERLLLAARQIDWIYPLIAAQPLDLAADATATAALFDYVRCFLALMRTAEGLAFRLVERADQVPWLPEATESERTRIGALVEPIERLDQDGDTAVLTLRLVHAKSLFRATLKVSPAGRIEMTGDEPLAEDLPVAAGPAVDLVVTE